MKRAVPLVLVVFMNEWVTAFFFCLKKNNWFHTFVFFAFWVADVKFETFFTEFFATLIYTFVAAGNIYFFIFIVVSFFINFVEFQ